MNLLVRYEDSDTPLHLIVGIVDADTLLLPQGIYYQFRTGADTSFHFIPWGRVIEVTGDGGFSGFIG